MRRSVIATVAVAVAVPSAAYAATATRSFTLDVCSRYLSGLATGVWFVTVSEDTLGTVPVHLRLSWPAS